MGKITKFQITSRGFNDAIDITSKINSIVKENNIQDGTVQVFAPDHTSCIIILPRGVPIVQDFLDVLGEFIPMDKVYKFDEKYNTNAYAHLRSVFLGNSVSILVENGVPDFGDGQMLFIDFDNKPANKLIKVHVGN
jgi:secondary thiamine-phosphate synthase enzyme